MDMSRRQTERSETNCCSCWQSSAEQRRGFFRRLGSVLVAAALWPSRSWAEKVGVRLAQVPKLKQVGGWMILRLKGKEILLVRDGLRSIRGLSPVCTHKKELLEYLPDKGYIRCPAHGSRFSLHGQVLKGPAKKALGVHPTSYDPERQLVIVELES